MNWRALAIATLVVLAGCGSFVGSDGGAGDRSPERTVTPAPVPEVTPTPDPWPVAPGLSARGVVDVNVLVDAHLAALNDTSYEFTEWRGSASPPNASVRLFPETRATVAAPSRYLVWTNSEMVRIDGAITHVGNYTEYVDAPTRLVRYRLVGQISPTVTRQFAVDAGYNELVGGRAATALLQYLTVANTSVARTTVDGQRYYAVSGFERSPGVPGHRNLSVSALVSPDGFVRSLNATYVAAGVDRPRRFRYRFAYEKVGATTLDAPDWARDQNQSVSGAKPGSGTEPAPETEPDPDTESTPNTGSDTETEPTPVTEPGTDTDSRAEGLP